jgi:hypothetical protein
VRNVAVEVLALQQTRTRVERTGEPFEGMLESEEKGTSATTKGELLKDQGYERTQEWWEGYDPGMDVDF